MARRKEEVHIDHNIERLMQRTDLKCVTRPYLPRAQRCPLCMRSVSFVDPACLSLACMQRPVTVSSRIVPAQPCNTSMAGVHVWTGDSRTRAVGAADNGSR